MKTPGKGSHPNSKKALKPFPKGTSGNPSGRPKGIPSLKDRFAKFMEIQITCDSPTGGQNIMSVGDGIVATLLIRSLKGDIYAIKETFDRFYGKETQKLDIMTPEKEETVITMEERIKKYARPD